MEPIQLTGYGKKRRELDFYPTPPEVTIALMEFLHIRNVLNLSKSVWECACGEGAMSEVLKRYHWNVVSSDIADTGYGFVADYLVCNPDVKFDAIITNPPFYLAADFIKKATSEAPVVAMLLKSQYWHAAKRLDLFESTQPAYLLPLTWRPDFLDGERGGAPTMEMAWTVWIEGITTCQYILLRKPKQNGSNL